MEILKRQRLDRVARGQRGEFIGQSLAFRHGHAPAPAALVGLELNEVVAVGQLGARQPGDPFGRGAQQHDVVEEGRRAVPVRD